MHVYIRATPFYVAVRRPHDVAKHDATKSVSGTSAGSKLSLSADSIDSEGAPFVDRHRVSKSILKKSDSGNNYYSSAGDSDTEKLITDNVSTTSVCDNETSTCDAYANANGTRARKRPVSPLLSRQVLESIFRTNNNTERQQYATGDETDRKTGGVVARAAKFPFGDVAGGSYTNFIGAILVHSFMRFDAIVPLSLSSSSMKVTLNE